MVGGALLRTLLRGLGSATLPSPSTQKGVHAQMTVAALQGRQKGRPKVRLASSCPPAQALFSSRLPPPGSPSCSLPSCRSNLGLPCARPSHISVLRILLLLSHHWGLSGMRGLLSVPSLEWTPMGSSFAPGIRTGKCVAFNDTVRTCEIFGWCPVEVDDNVPR